MSFKSYITYDEYKAFGGSLDESAFAISERRAQRFVDAITFERIKKLTIIPDEVKEFIVECMREMDDWDNKQKENGGNVASYSNGVESITYSDADKTFEDVKQYLIKVAYEWLPLYLTTRVAGYDIEAYLQQQSKYSQ